LFIEREGRENERAELRERERKELGEWFFASRFSLGNLPLWPVVGGRERNLVSSSRALFVALQITFSRSAATRHGDSFRWMASSQRKTKRASGTSHRSRVEGTGIEALALLFRPKNDTERTKSKGQRAASAPRPRSSFCAPLSLASSAAPVSLVVDERSDDRGGSKQVLQGLHRGGSKEKIGGREIPPAALPASRFVSPSLSLLAGR
jgi:hypothetical protein